MTPLQATEEKSERNAELANLTHVNGKSVLHMYACLHVLSQHLCSTCTLDCRQLEDALDHKNAELIDLRKAALEHAVASPIKPSSHLQSALCMA